MPARAVVFDVMGTLFDLSAAREAFRSVGAGAGALEAWFGRLLHSAVSLTVAGRFHPFAEVARSTVRTTLAQLGLDPEAGPAMLDALRSLDPYPDAAAAVARLAEAGVPMLALTNGGAAHTQHLLARGGFDTMFTGVLAADEVGVYKPHREMYLAAARRLGFEPASVTLIAGHGWDVMGAAQAGLSAVWISRGEKVWPFPWEPPASAAGLVDAVERALQ